MKSLINYIVESENAKESTKISKDTLNKFLNDYKLDGSVLDKMSIEELKKAFPGIESLESDMCRGEMILNTLRSKKKLYHIQDNFDLDIDDLKQFAKILKKYCAEFTTYKSDDGWKTCYASEYPESLLNLIN